MGKFSKYGIQVNNDIKKVLFNIEIDYLIDGEHLFFRMRNKKKNHYIDSW